MPKRPLLAQSPGLPPAGVGDPNAAQARRAKFYPAKKGRTEAEKQEVVEKTVALAQQGVPAEEIAKKTETALRTTKEIIKSARKKLADRAEAYVDIHHAAAVVAASQGDAKPAQWALERIADGGERIVDPPTQQSSAPTFNIGIALGGMPAAKPLPPVQTSELPPLDAEPIDAP